jgi:hypothetical protein
MRATSVAAKPAGTVIQGAGCSAWAASVGSSAATGDGARLGASRPSSNASRATAVNMGEVTSMTSSPHGGPDG